MVCYAYLQQFPVVSPVLPRPSLDVSPTPSPRPAPALVSQGWQRLIPRPKHPQVWGLGLGSLALGLVNGALVISAGVGLVAYQQLLQLSPRQRKGLMQRLQQGLPLPTTPRQQALVLGLVTGASTYTFTALWHSTHSLLMALLLTGQGALALFAVGALLRSSPTAGRSDDLWDASPMAQVDHNLGLLSHPDPLKRLVAVRRLVRLAQMDEEYLVGLSVRSHLIDCFQLRLGQENDAIVRSALEEGLALLRQTQSLAPSPAMPFIVESASDEAGVADRAVSRSPGFAAAIAEPPPRLEATSSTATPDLQVTASAVEASTQASMPKARRSAVEYVEYLDI